MTKSLHIGLTTAIVIEILQAIKKGDRNPDLCLEGNLLEHAEKRVAQAYLLPLSLWFRKAASEQWKHYSGDINWPIPSPDGSPPGEYALKPYPLGEDHHWGGEYGKMQLDLLDTLVGYLKLFPGYTFGLTDTWSSPSSTTAARRWLDDVKKRVKPLGITNIENCSVEAIPGLCRSALDFVLNCFQGKTINDLTSVGVYPPTDISGIHFFRDDRSPHISSLTPLPVFFMYWDLLVEAERRLRRRNEIFVRERLAVATIHERVEFLAIEAAHVCRTPESKVNALLKRFHENVKIMNDLAKCRRSIFHDVVVASPAGGRTAKYMISFSSITHTVELASGVDIPDFKE